MSTDNVDLVIAGGSFAGLTCARAASLRGLRVTVLERKPDPGAQPHTTGLLVKEASDEWEVPRHLTRKIHGVRLYSPSLRWIDLRSPGYYFLATDTPGMLQWFASQAESAGARLTCGKEYTGAHRENNMIRILNPDLACRFLVGADGARSRVAMDFGLGQNQKFLTGLEEEYEGVQGVDNNLLHCFIDSELAPGYIAWVIPGVGITQVGLACCSPLPPKLDRFVSRIKSLFDFRKARIVSRRGGLIPVGGPVTPLACPQVLLVGDASGYVSPFTAGGIHTALHIGRRAGQLIADHLLDGAPEPLQTLKTSFPNFFWKKFLRFAINLHPPNALLNVFLDNPFFRSLAQTVFFRYHGLLSKPN
jgi:flavin-dependent dehydrogenase